MSKKKWLDKFSCKLRQLREKNLMTQTAMSKIIGISPTAYGMYEQGEREPTISNIRKIAKYFNVSVDNLIFGDFTNAKIFWTENHYKITVNGDNSVEMLLPVPTVTQTVDNGKIVYLKGKTRKIIFSDKQSFIDFTEETQHKHKSDYIAACAADVLNLYNQTSGNETDIIKTKEESFEKAFVPAS